MGGAEAALLEVENLLAETTSTADVTAAEKHHRGDATISIQADGYVVVWNSGNAMREENVQVTC